MSIARRLKSYFSRGLAVLLPTILTISIFVWGYRFIQDNIGVHINRLVVWVIMYVLRIDYADEAARQPLEQVWVNGWGSIAGFIVALIGVCVIGAVLASVLGRGLWRRVEALITGAPFVRRVYPHIKQITDFLFAQDRKEKLFSRVVAVEYPRKGIWTLGFVTGSGLQKIKENIKKEFLTILIPTSPTPFTGFVIMVPKDDTIDLDVSLEEALRFTISGGVITPSHKFDEKGVLTLPKAGADGS